jgi:carbon monoxide dehydrogenase subunit G
VWGLIEDPNHMPRWWPGVVRMESVQTDHFTQVFMTKKGRAVRLDFQLLESQPPDATGDVPGHRAWTQEIAGTPFERVLEESVIEVVLERDGAGTRVTIAQRQKLKGYSRTGGFLLRRATREKLTEALDGIERALG